MPDPLDALPYEIWIWCITLSIDGQHAGPLQLLAVSRRWERLLLDTPSLWSQIYIQNGEDEIARISAFLHFSKKCSLHVDIMTPIPTKDSLHLIAEQISRVTTILIRPGTLDTITTLHWKQATSHILTMLSNGLAPDVKSASCFGISLWANGRLYYCIVLVQFALAISAEPPAMANSGMWEEQVARITRVSTDQDANARTDSIYSIAQLASYAQYHSAIRIALPSLTKLLEDDDSSIRSATLDALHAFAVHNELREALTVAVSPLIKVLGNGTHDLQHSALSLLNIWRNTASELHEGLSLSIPSIIELLDDGDSDVRSTAVSLLEWLADHGDFHEELALSIPSLVELLEDGDLDIRSTAASLLEWLADHGRFREPLSLCIPSIIGLLKHKYWSIRSTAVSLLEKLAKQDELHDALMLIPPLNGLHERGNRFLGYEVVSILERLGKHDELQGALPLVVPSLIELLDSMVEDEIRPILSLLERLAKHNQLHESLRSTTQSLTRVVNYRDSAFASTASSLLDMLQSAAPSI